MINRRHFLAASAAAGLLRLPAAAQTPVARIADLNIDLAGEPDNLDPALARSYRDWSLVHSIHDSIIHVGQDGTIEPLAAEAFETIDDVTWEVRLRANLTFHDGTPVTSTAIERGILHVQQSEGPASASFGVISAVEIVDDLTARLVTSIPAPWLPYQLAVWMVLLPDGEQDFEQQPIGCGPFAFEGRESGASITLSRFGAYPQDSAKGVAIADAVTFRFVPDQATRIADLSTGAAHIVDTIDAEQRQAVADAGATPVMAPVVGAAFIRVVNDVPPFDDPRVIQSLNHAIDVDTIATTLIAADAHRLASLFPDERSMGFDQALSPFDFDPERARALLTEAGYGDGFEARLQFTPGARVDVLESISAFLADIGVTIKLESTELATFNGTWTEPDSAPLRLVTWRPLFDPHTLLSLMFAGDGPLSRFSEPVVDQLIADAAITTDVTAREALYRQLGEQFQATPPAIFLWNLIAMYGVKGEAAAWHPRGDEYVIPTGKAL